MTKRRGKKQVDEPKVIEHKPEVVQPEKPTKVAIVGCSQSKTLAPFNDPSFEIWGMNNLFPHLPRATRWFEIHDIAFENNTYLRRNGKDFRGQPVGEYLEQLGKWAEENNCPVYMQRKWDLIPTATEFPVQQMLDSFGGYFTNSVSWMLALAIAEGFKEIHVYGVDMAVDTEYHHQRPSCEYFLGVAAGLGIKVVIPAEADLLKTRWLYAFQEKEAQDWSRKVKMMKQTVVEKKDRINKEIDQFTKEIKFREAQLQQFVGAEHAMGEMDKIWS